MLQEKQVDILIIGSGPAGMSVALHLIREDIKWAEKIIILDKAIHPREKLCGGAVTELGDEVLSNLGLSFDPAHVAISEMQLIYNNRSIKIKDDPILKITRRDEFDHWLVKQGENQGIVVNQGEAVKSIIPGRDFVEVRTDSDTYHAKILVAADGSKSFVRQKLKWGNKSQTARLLEVLTPETPQQEYFKDSIAVFDFSPMDGGLQGYYWDFPSMINSQPFMNRGVFDSRTWQNKEKVQLKKMFGNELNKRNRSLDGLELKGHPIYWFDSDSDFARHRILLAGDSAGVDPFLGEGISFALAYGEVAADEIISAFESSNFDFAKYKGRILKHPILRQLNIRRKLAQFMYRTNNKFLLSRLWDFMIVLTWLTMAYRRAKRKFKPSE